MSGTKEHTKAKIINLLESWELEMILNAGLFHYLVCHVPGFYFTIDWKRVIIYRAKPHIVIAFAVPLKIASVFVKLFPNTFFVFRHYA
jgi:hypothetical protein